MGSGAVAPDDRLYVLGHPRGLPLKLAPDGRTFATKWYDGTPVSAEEAKLFLYTDLSIFSGNSGGPAFSVKNHRLEGIVRGGEDDYRYDIASDCATSLCGGLIAQKCTRRESISRLNAIPAWMLALIRESGGGEKDAPKPETKE